MPLAHIRRSFCNLLTTFRGSKSLRPTKFTPDLDLLEERSVPALNLVSNPYADPYAAVVQLKIEWKDGGTPSLGSGALVDKNSVLTAGHCVYDAQRGGWAKSIEVSAGYSEDYNYGTPFDQSTSFKMTTFKTFTSNPKYEFIDDIAVISLRDSIGQHTGWFGLETVDSDVAGRYLNSVGYPGEPYDGNTMYHTYGPVNGLTTYSNFYGSTEIMTWHNDPSDVFENHLSSHGGQSGSPIFRYDSATKECHIEAVCVALDKYSDAAYGVALTNSMFDTIVSWMKADDGGPSGNASGHTAVDVGSGGQAIGTDNPNPPPPPPPQPTPTSIDASVASENTDQGQPAYVYVSLSNSSGVKNGGLTFYDNGVMIHWEPVWPSPQQTIYATTFKTDSLGLGNHSIHAAYAAYNDQTLSYTGETVASNGTGITVHARPSIDRLMAVANSLTHSDEYYRRVITTAYQQFLGRAPDPSGVNGWLLQMRQGLSDESLEANFIGSPEYILNHGGTGEAWVQGMYFDLLGRAPDATGIANWIAQLNAGVAPQSIAYGFAASRERESQHVANNYQKYLGRLPDPAGLNGWVDAFVYNGATNEDLISGFIGSNEYFYRASNNTNAWFNLSYYQVLGRLPGSGDISAWQGILGVPLSPLPDVIAFLNM